MNSLDSLQHTLDHFPCPACDAMRKHSSGILTGDMFFFVASKKWLGARTEIPASGRETARFISPRTARSYQEYRDALSVFFGSLRLGDIHIGHLRSYQDMRAERVKPKKVNQELGLLRQILTRADCWTPELEKHYEPLLERPADLPRSLSPAQEKHWLETCARRERWHVIWWYCLLSFATTMGTNEMRALRVHDLSLAERMAYVSAEGAKTPYRLRSIPLVSNETLYAARELVGRAYRLGAKEPDHYIFPFHKRPSPVDPSRPMTVEGLKYLWKEVRKASGLTWFRPYDTRHTAITRMAESGMDFPMIQAFAGHISARMTRHYIQISNEAKRRALQKMHDLKKPPQSVAVNCDGGLIRQPNLRIAF